MRLKSFYGKTATEAMSKVKEELGSNAVILSLTQENPQSFHITASIEQTDPNIIKNESHELNEDIIEDLHDFLVAEKMPYESLQTILNDVEIHLEKDIETTLKNYFLKKFSSSRLDAHIDLLIGNFGAGKTLSTIKLATEYHLKGQSIGLITSDHEKTGGIEQLEHAAAILDAELTTVEDLHALVAAIEFNQVRDKIIVDTGGLNPYNPNHLAMIQHIQSKSFDLNTIFVTPANVDPFELEDSLNALTSLKIDSICYTKLDLCRRHAALLHSLTLFEFSDYYFSDTDSVDQELMFLNAELLSNLLLHKIEHPYFLKKVS